LNILYISPCQGAFGGIEAFVLAVADELYSCGASVQVLFKKVKGFQLKDSLQQAIQIRRYPIRFIARGDFATIFRSVKWADVVHGHNPLLEVVVSALWLRKPCVLTVYNWCRKNLHPRPVLWRVANKLADHSWYISDFVWNTWEDKRQDKSGKLPIVSSLPSRVTPYKDRAGFIFASRWIPNKGIRTLLQAYSMSNIDKSKWPLVLLGDGPLREEVLAMIERDGIHGVEIPGFLPDHERNLKISQAKWMITPPKTNEDLGLTAIEARNVKVPCIVTHDGGLPEAAGKFSLSCQPGNIVDLAELLETVALISEEDYIQLAENTYFQLRSYLKPLNLYRQAYQVVIRSYQE